MSPSILVPALTCLAFASADETPRYEPDLEAKSGTIALSDWPFCDFFVIDTGHGFALVQWASGMWIFDEADPVLGRVDRTGVQTIHVDGLITAGDMTVNVEEVGVDLRLAQRAFYRRCKIR